MNTVQKLLDQIAKERAAGIAAIQRLTAENDRLRAQLPSQGGEAVAWMLADAVGGSMLEFQRDLLLENQCRYGGEIVPLYTHPAAPGAVAVRRELLDRIAKRPCTLAEEGERNVALNELRNLLAKSEVVKP